MNVKSIRSSVGSFSSLLCASILLIVMFAPHGAKTGGAYAMQTDIGGNVFYVSPDGSPEGKGKKKKPWDLETALSHPNKVKPGDTIYLRGGVYKGKFVSKLTGSPDSPITVRSYPGEWAKIDGYYTVALNGSLSSSATSLTLSDASRIPEASDLLIDDEMVKVHARSGNSFTDVVRAASGGGMAASHSNGATVILGGNVLGVFGSDTIYRDFEITNSWTLRTQDSLAPKILARGEGIALRGARTRAINLVVHDNLDGIGAWSQAPDSEIYGCIVYNNGITSTQSGHPASGHGMYHENASGTRIISDNIVFNNFNLGTQAFGVTGPFVGGRFDGNVYFNNSSPTYRGANQVNIGLLIGTQSQLIPSVTVTNNFFYQRPGVPGNTLKLGYGGLLNGTAIVTGNYFGGGTELLNADNWASGTYSNNIFCAVGPNSAIANVRTAGGSYSWNNNTYYDQSHIENCSGGNRRNPFAYNGASGGCGGYLDFNEWKATNGFDAKSKYIQSLPPNRVFIRRNQYDTGRAHIVVYNWTHAATVNVNVSEIMTVGTAYEIRSAQNYFGPAVLSGTYKGGTLQLPMTDLSVATPIGYDYTPATTGPEFNVFVLITR